MKIINPTLLIQVLGIHLILISCGIKTTELYVFDPNNLKSNKIKLSEIADEISYVPLDNKIPLNGIYDIEFDNGQFILSAKDNGILIYSGDGKLQSKIGSIGRGPGEYKYHQYFAFDKENRNIYVLDYLNIKTYSRSGKFLRAISLDETGGHFFDITYWESKLFLSEYIISGNAVYDWLIIDTLGNVIHSKKNTVPAFKSTFGKRGGTYLSGDLIHYWNTYNDTVFLITPDLKYSEALIFKEGDHRLPRGVFDIDRAVDFMFVGSIFESKNFLFLKFRYHNESLAIIDKRNYREYTEYSNDPNDYFGIENDLDGGVRFSPYFYFEDQGKEYMIKVVEAYEFKSFASKVKLESSGHSSVSNLANSLDENDNPILMIVRIKK